MKIFGLLLAALVGSAGCTKVDSFNCLESSECVYSGVAGVCELGGLCSFPNPDCPSGKAYGEFAGGQAGLCVDAGSGSTTTPTSSVSNTDSATSVDPSNGSDTTVDPTTETTVTSEVTATTGTTGTTDPSTTDPSTTTGGPTCALLGDACTADTPCCGDGCTECIDGTCTALPPESGPGVCGGSTCQECSAGACAPALAGKECIADCSDFVLQPQSAGEQTSCDGYAPAPLMGTCDDGGLCTPLESVVVACSPDMPNQLAVCDTTCVQDLGVCTLGATGFDKADFCALSGPGPGCKTVCMEDNSSNMASCDGDGFCQQNPVPCGNYSCEIATGLCRTKCGAPSDCAAGHDCKGMKCQ